MTNPTLKLSVVCCDKCGQKLPRTLGERVRAARRNRGLSRVGVERAARLAQGTMTRYEQDRRLPSIDSARKLSLVLGVSVDWLLGT